MELVDVQTREVFILLEMSLPNLKHLEFILRNSELTFDSKIPEQAKAEEYLIDKLYPFIQATIKQIEEGFPHVRSNS